MHSDQYAPRNIKSLEKEMRQHNVPLKTRLQWHSRIFGGRGGLKSEDLYRISQGKRKEYVYIFPYVKNAPPEVNRILEETYRRHRTQGADKKTAGIASWQAVKRAGYRKVMKVQPSWEKQRQYSRYTRDLPPEWTQDYVAAVKAISGKHKDEPETKKLQQHFERLKGHLRRTGRDVDIYVPEPDQFGYHPHFDLDNAENLSSVHNLIKHAVRRNTAAAEKKKAWEQIKARGRAHRPLQSHQPNDLDKLQKRKFMEQALVALPVTKGREPRFLGEKVPGEINFDRPTASIVPIKGMNPEEFQGFTMRKFNMLALPMHYERREGMWGRHIHRKQAREIAHEIKQLQMLHSKLPQDVQQRRAIPFARQIERLHDDMFEHQRRGGLIFSREGGMQYGFKNSIGLMNTVLNASGPAARKASAALMRELGGLAVKTGVSTAVFLTGMKLAERRKGRPLSTGELVVTRNMPGFVEGFNQGQLKLLTPNKSKVRKTKKYSIYYGKARIAKTASSKLIKPIRKAVDWWQGKGTSARGQLFEKTANQFLPPMIGKAKTQKVIKGVQQAAEADNRSLRQHLFWLGAAPPIGGSAIAMAHAQHGFNKINRKLDSGKKYSLQACYELGMHYGFKDFWKRFHKEAVPNMKRAAALEGLSAINTTLGLPPTLVEGVAVQRHSGDKSLQPYPTIKLETIHHKLTQQLNNTRLDKLTREAIEHQLSKIKGELAFRKTM